MLYKLCSLWVNLRFSFVMSLWMLDLLYISLWFFVLIIVFLLFLFALFFCIVEYSSIVVGVRFTNYVSHFLSFFVLCIFLGFYAYISLILRSYNYFPFSCFCFLCGIGVLEFYGLSSFAPHRLVCKNLCLISVIYRDTL